MIIAQDAHLKMRFFKKIKKCIVTGHAKHDLEEKLPEDKIELCEHNSYCFKRQQQGYNCFAKQEARDCGQVKRFYDKYKEAGNQFGVGS